MDGLGRRRAYVTILVAAFVSALLLGTTQQVFADNIISNTGTTDKTITFNAGTSNTDLKIKVVANTAQSQAGDDQSGCNADDGTPAKVTLNISPAQGLTATPNPVVFDKCGTQKTVTLTSNVGGTYTITASVQDDGSHDSFGIYHLEPFGTVTVIVVDTTPPETTITSTPANPTTSQTASFTYSSSEAGSTFECSLDGGAFAACPVDGISYPGLADGSHTFQVRAKDPSGNIDATPASFPWTIRQATIAITSVTPSTPPAISWGTPVTVQGTVDVVDLTGVIVKIDWGDGSTSDATIGGGSWGPVSHSYNDPGTYSIVARLTDGTNDFATSGSSSVDITKRASELSLIIPDVVTVNTGLNARGVLTEYPSGAEISGGLITFDGSGSNPSFESVTTEGVTVKGGLELVSCSVGPCSPEERGIDASPNTNIVIRVSPGSEFKFPAGTAQVMLTVQGNTQFKYTLYENPDSPLACQDEPASVECNSSVGDSVGVIRTIGGFSDISTGNTREYVGLNRLVITEVEGSTTDGFVDISSIYTSNPDGKPLEHLEINLEDQALGPVTDPVTFNRGSFSSIGIVQNTAEEGLTLQAHFGENSHYFGSDSSVQVYKTDGNSNAQFGVGGESVVGDGAAASRDICAVDGDHDGICSTWEDGTVERSGGGVYTLFDAPAGDGTPDVYYEVDCMTGYCPTAGDLDAIKGRFDLKGIKLHFQLDETGLAVKNPFHVWTDGTDDGIANNAFVEVKNSKFGTSGDRAAGSNVVKAKLEVVRYLVVVQNINSGTSTSCGTSGVAEYRGNDAVVAVKACGFGTNPSEEIRGTIMHEIGHNLGLKHGGGDDINCKVNQRSVMSYVSQVPTSLLPKPTAAQSGDGDQTVETVNQVPWILDYNREALPALLESDVDDGFVLNITPSKWIAADGKDQIGSWKTIWGTPQLSTKVQTGYTGAAGTNWDKDGNSGELNQQMDLNYYSFTIGGKTITACQPANSYFPSYPADKAETLTSYDEWQIVKNNLDEFTTYASFDGVRPDPDFFSDSTDVIQALNSAAFQTPGVGSPLNNVDLGSTDITKIKLGNTVPVKFDLFDSNGVEITGDNYQNYHIKTVDNHPLIIIQVAPSDGINPSADKDYGPPLTSTQTDKRDYFTWDGSKWAFSMGTKNLQINKIFAARISLVFDTGEQLVVESGSDGITFLFKTVKTL